MFIYLTTVYTGVASAVIRYILNSCCDLPDTSEPAIARMILFVFTPGYLRCLHNLINPSGYSKILENCHLSKGVQTSDPAGEKPESTE
jgi:hypothetical protein